MEIRPNFHCPARLCMQEDMSTPHLIRVFSALLATKLDVHGEYLEILWLRNGSYVNSNPLLSRDTSHVRAKCNQSQAHTRNPTTVLVYQRWIAYSCSQRPRKMRLHTVSTVDSQHSFALTWPLNVPSSQGVHTVGCVGTKESTRCPASQFFLTFRR